MDERQILANASRFTRPGEREAYLARACAGNLQLRADVEALLKANAKDLGFLEQSPVERYVEAFEEAASRDATPRLEDFLPAPDSGDQSVLIDLVRADLECRLKAGMKARVEDYLQRFPELEKDGAILIDLVDLERQQRQRQNEETPWAEYERRFPLFREVLRTRWHLVVMDCYTTVTEAPRSAHEDSLLPAGAAWPKVAGYEILAELGRGGMGVVYKAQQIQLNRVVALKMILAGSNADRTDRARFRAEAEAVARLKHENIVQIYEIGETDGMPFFSLEFVEGGPLDRRLKTSPLPARDAARLVETLARAMHYAHQHGIVHRDLKPANILLSGGGPEGRGEDTKPLSSRGSDPWPLATPKIADFGLAKRLDGDGGHTQTGVIMGTPSYMAPEQAAGKIREIGPAADVYALGALLYDMLVGRPPFKAATPMETVHQVLSEEPISLRQLQPKVPRDLETICLKCLEKDQKKRYATAEALADDLRHFTRGEPIQARPTPTWERLAKWARRKPAAAGLVFATLVVALAVMISVTLFAFYESQRAGVAEQKLEVHKWSSETLQQARQWEAVENWNAAHTELEKAQSALDAQPDLRADDLRDELHRHLILVRQKLHEQKQRQKAQERLRDFRSLYDDALSYHTQLTVLHIADSRTNTLAAIRAGLTKYGLNGEAADSDRWLSQFQFDKLYLSPAEHAGLASACYELLVILAEAEAVPLAGQPESQRQRGDKALAVLASAAQLGHVYNLETRTYHLYKARYLAQSKGEIFDPAAAEKVAPQQPTGRLDWFLTALENRRQNKFPEAIAACDHILHDLKQRDDFWARYLKALCLLRLNQWADAKAELTVCLNLKHDFAWPRLLRGFASSELRTFKAAKDDFDSALAQDRGPLVQYVGLVNRGVLFIRQRNWPEAIADLQQAVQVNPKEFQGFLNLAQAFQGMGKRADALAAMNQAVSKAPKLVEVYDSRARLHLAQQHREKARDDFKEAIALEPKGSKSNRLVNNLIELGKLLHREESYPAALACYDTALKLKPELVLTQRFRVETLLALNHFKEAGEALDSYLAVNKQPPAEVYEARGILYARKGQMPAAIEMYTLTLRQNPADSGARCQRGWAYLLVDAVPLALEDFQNCLRMDKTNLDALIGRGNARIRLKKLDAALEDAGAAEKRGELTDRLFYNLARIYAQAAGQWEAERKASRTGMDQRSAQRLALYKEKAVNCLRQTLEKLPSERRAAFWRDQIQPDPAFLPIRGERVYLQLAALYAGKG